MKASQFFFFVAVIFAFGFMVGEAVRCGKYNPSPDLNKQNYPTDKDYDRDRKYYGPPHICDQLLTENQRTFFVLDQNSTDKKAIETQAFVNALNLGAIQPVCRTMATIYLCSFAFRPCNMNPLSPSLPNFLVFPLPSPPCKSVCQAYRKYCKDDVPAESLPDCDAVDESGQPEYPENSKKFFVNGNTYNIGCNRYDDIDQIEKLYDEDKNKFVLYDEDHKKASWKDKKKLKEKLKGLDIDPVVCSFPLDLNKNYVFHEEGENPCMPTCPNPGSYTHDEWENVKKEKLAFTIISLALDIWVFVTLITIKERRLFPANLAIFVAFMHILWFIIFVIAAARMDTTQCRDRFHFSTTWDDYLCGIEGMFLYYGALAIANAWAAIAINLFLLVVMEIKPKRVRKYQIFWYIAILFVPTVGAIIIYATSNFYASPGYPWCFVRPEEYNYPLFWAWILLDIVFVLFAAFATLFKMVMVKRAMSSRASFSKNINILLFLVCFLFVYGFNIAILFYNQVHGDSFQESLVDYIRCNGFTGNQVFGKCERPDILEVATMYVYVWVLAGSGMFIFIPWGLSPAYIKHWSRLLKNLFTCNFKSVADMGLSSSASTTQSRTRDSKG